MNQSIDWNKISIPDLKNLNCRKDNNGITALHYLAYYNADEGVIDHAFTRSADVNAQDKYGRTPLHFSVMGANKLAVMQKSLSAAATLICMMLREIRLCTSPRFIWKTSCYCVS